MVRSINISRHSIWYNIGPYNSLLFLIILSAKRLKGREDMQTIIYNIKIWRLYSDIYKADIFDTNIMMRLCCVVACVHKMYEHSSVVLERK